MNARPAIPRRRAAPGFSLLEIVMVLGLLTILAGVVASMSFDSLFNAGQTKSAYEVFREATHEARIQALNESRIVYLSFDEEAQEFRLTKASKEPENFEIEKPRGFDAWYTQDEEESPPPDPDAPREVFPVFEDELEVEFRGVRAESDGVAAFDREYTDEPIPHLVFHPSGVSSPAIAIFRFRNGDEEELTLDTLSNGPKLLADDGDYY
ncbi:MAG: pilus assembly FimT family protein [Puniceicoccales bacterium]